MVVPLWRTDRDSVCAYLMRNHDRGVEVSRKGSYGTEASNRSIAAPIDPEKRGKTERAASMPHRYPSLTRDPTSSSIRR